MPGGNRYEIIYRLHGSPQAFIVELDGPPSSADIHALLVERHGIPLGETTPKDNRDYLRLTTGHGIQDVAVRRKY